MKYDKFKIHLKYSPSTSQQTNLCDTKIKKEFNLKFVTQHKN